MSDSPPDVDPLSKPRGLWSLMAQAPPKAPLETDTEEPSAPPRSLFEVMRQGATTDSHQPDPSMESVVERFADPSEILEATRPQAEAEINDVLFPFAGIDRREPKRSEISTRRRRQSLTGLACGVISVALSVLAIRPEVWMSLPASLFGFAAVIRGYLTLTGSRLRDHTSLTKWASVASIVLGILGLFLGPLCISEMGRRWRESSGHNLNRQHLLPERAVPLHDRPRSRSALVCLQSLGRHCVSEDSDAVAPF